MKSNRHHSSLLLLNRLLIAAMLWISIGNIIDFHLYRIWGIHISLQDQTIPPSYKTIKKSDLSDKHLNKAPISDYILISANNSYEPLSTLLDRLNKKAIITRISIASDFSLRGPPEFSIIS